VGRCHEEGMRAACRECEEVERQAHYIVGFEFFVENSTPKQVMSTDLLHICVNSKF
jgi:hypothetical protein